MLATLRPWEHSPRWGAVILFQRQAPRWGARGEQDQTAMLRTLIDDLVP